ncbi:amidase [Geminicoccaceae bacterium 1502E]|nr:amidase [Geminicoccaceae bacterium 1502E]
MSADILSLGLCELAAAIAGGEVTSQAATEASLDALEQHGPALNAVARLRREQALEQAEACDRERRAGRLRGPLHGVPLAHKDMFHRKGELGECGAALMKGNRAAATATAIERLDEAGAIDIGRLNMVEFALGITGHNAHTGHPRNAWDLSRITGGSTSGGATAVAARLVAATLGSDTGGSIRVPSALCNLVGIKPTYGRVSRAGAMPLAFSLDHVGPLCRSAEDAALMLQAIAGQDPRDRTSSPRPVPDYRAALKDDLRGVRVTSARDCFESAIDGQVQGLMDEAMQAMAGLGAKVAPRVLPGMERLNALRRVVMMSEAAAYHRELIRTRREAYNPQTTSRMVPGFALSAVDYLTALSARATCLEEFCAVAFAEADILAMPTTPAPTPTIAETDTGGDPGFVALANAVGSIVMPFNYLGLPALSVPMGFDANGMPVGLHLVGRPFAEGLLLRAAHAFEKATGFSARRPSFPAGS